MPRLLIKFDESSDTLVELFDSLQLYLQRIDNSTETYTAGIKVLLLKVMAEALSTLAAFTKGMKEKPISVLISFMQPSPWLTIEQKRC